MFQISDDHIDEIVVYNEMTISTAFQQASEDMEGIQTLLIRTESSLQKSLRRKSP